MKELVKELQSQGEELFTEAFEDVLDGAKEDLRRFGRDMAKDAASAALLADESERFECLREIRAQTKALIELNRLRVVNEQWELAEKLVTLAAKGIVMAGQVGLTAATLAKKGGLA